MATFTNQFTGSIVDPTDVSYQILVLTRNVQLVWPSYLPPDLTGLAVASRIIDLYTNATGLQVELPQGNLGSPGADILFNNKSGIPIVVTDFDGQNSVVIDPGVARYFYLSDNNSLAGVWTNTTLGAGTSSADAATLVGPGLTTVTGRLAETISITNFASPTLQIGDTDRARAFVWQGGVGQLTLPSTSLLSPGWFIWLRNNGSGTLTVVPGDAAARINSLTALQFEVGTSSIIAYDPSSVGFYALGTVANQNFAFSSATYDVDVIPGSTLNLTAGAPIIQQFVSLGSVRTTNLLVVLPATTALYALINLTNDSGYNIQFQLSGSTQAPVVITTGTQSFVVSNGRSLFVLNTSNLGGLSLSNGSASAPPLNFSDEVNSGFFKAGALQPAITAGGNTIAIFNGSDPTNLTLQSPANAIFKSINGGLI